MFEFLMNLVPFIMYSYTYCMKYVIQVNRIMCYCVLVSVPMFQIENALISMFCIKNIIQNINHASNSYFKLIKAFFFINKYYYKRIMLRKYQNSTTISTKF